jgi:hypothetical protein
MHAEHYCHNCGWFRELTDGTWCSWCIAFFRAHGRMPRPADK